MRIATFSFSVLLVPLLGLAFVRFVWQDVGRPGVTPFEVVRRTALLAAAGLVAYAALRVAGALVKITVRGVDALGGRLDHRLRRLP